MATGKKAPAPGEEKPAEPEAVELPKEVAAVATEQPPAAETAPEVAAETAPAETQPEAVAVVESMVVVEQVVEEVIDTRPFHEPAEAPAEIPVAAASEPVEEESAPVEAPPAEAVSEPVAEAQPEPVAASAVVEIPVEAEPEPAAAVEPVLEELFHPAPAEAASEPVAEAPIAEPESEPAVEAAVEPAVTEPEPEPVAASEPAAAEERVADRPFHEPEVEAPAEAVAEASAAESAEAEEPAADEQGQEVAPAAEVVSAPAAAAQESRPEAESGPKRVRSIPRYGDLEEERFNLEKYKRRAANERLGGAKGPDVVPSPDETTYLKSMGKSSDEITEEELRRLSQDPMWKTLIQFKGWLPVVTSLLPMLDLASGRANPAGGDEIKDTMDGLLMSNRDVRATLNSQTNELRRVEDEVSKLREAADKTAFEQTAMADDVRGMQRLLKNASLYVGILLGLLVAVVGYMAFLVFSYLNHPVH